MFEANGVVVHENKQKRKIVLQSLFFLLGLLVSLTICVIISTLIKNPTISSSNYLELNNNINIKKIKPVLLTSSLSSTSSSSSLFLLRNTNKKTEKVKEKIIKTDLCPSSGIAFSGVHVCMNGNILAIVAFSAQFQLDLDFIRENPDISAIISLNPPKPVVLTSDIALLEDLSFIVTDTSFSGSLPTQIGLMKKMVYIDFRDNLFENSTISSEIGMLSNIIQILLTGNSFRGKIPSELSSLSNTGRIDVSSNYLVGPIPTEIAIITKLSDLDISSNLMRSPIISEIGKLTNMRRFLTSTSLINGTIPSQLGLLTELTLLNIRNNLISGTLPTELGLLTNLLYFHLQQNLISGTFPTEIQGIKSLKYLTLNNNSFTGTISETFKNQLMTFHCDYSGLDGCLEECSSCELYEISFGKCDGSGRRANCLPCYYFIPILLFIIGILVFFLSVVFPESTKKHTFIFAFIGSIFGFLDTITDIAFALVTNYNYNNNSISIASWVFIAIFMFVNVITIIIVISASAKQRDQDGDFMNSEFHRRFVSREVLYAITVILLMMNIRMLPFIMNLNDRNTRSILGRLTASLVLLFQDIPQLILQIVVFVRGDETFFVVFSLSLTAISLLYEIVSGPAFEPARRRMSTRAIRAVSKTPQFTQ